jgi:lysozyme
MNFLRLIDQLEVDEDVVLTVYLDSEGNPTVGIGHLVRPEDHLRLGDTITLERCYRLFAQDLSLAVWQCERHIYGFSRMPDTIQEVLANMMFNLGPVRLGGFRRMTGAAIIHDWTWMADEMQDSLWYTQVGARAQRLRARVMEVAYGATDAPHSGAHG